MISINARAAGVEPTLEDLEAPVLAVILRPQKIQSPSLGSNCLFSFLMQSVLVATWAMLVHFQAFLQELLIFTRKIIDSLAFSTLHFDHVIL